MIAPKKGKLYKNISGRNLWNVVLGVNPNDDPYYKNRIGYVLDNSIVMVLDFAPIYFKEHKTDFFHVKVLYKDRIGVIYDPLLREINHIDRFLKTEDT